MTPRLSRSAIASPIRLAAAWLALATLLACGGGQPEAPPPPAPDAGAPEAPGAPAGEPGAGVLTPQDERRVCLLFPSADGEALLPETRVIFLTNTLTSQVKQAVAELLAGPQGNDKVAPFPTSTPLRAVFLLRDGTAVIDLGREAMQIPGGSSAETDAVFALVDSLAVNFPAVRRVQILIEGEEVETLTGHLDTSRPLAADLKRVRWGDSGPPASAGLGGPATAPGDEPAESGRAEPAEPARAEPVEATRAEPVEAPVPASLRHSGESRNPPAALRCTSPPIPVIPCTMTPVSNVTPAKAGAESTGGYVPVSRTALVVPAAKRRGQPRRREAGGSRLSPGRRRGGTAERRVPLRHSDGKSAITAVQVAEVKMRAGVQSGEGCEPPPRFQPPPQ